jgi:hypothetical protein
VRVGQSGLYARRVRLRVVKQIHIWPNHVRIPHLDLVLFRPQGETLDHSLSALARFGLDTSPENVELHGDLQVA